MKLIYSRWELSDVQGMIIVYIQCISLMVFDWKVGLCVPCHRKPDLIIWAVWNSYTDFFLTLTRSYMQIQARERRKNKIKLQRSQKQKSHYSYMWISQSNKCNESLLSLCLRPCAHPAKLQWPPSRPLKN